MSGHLNGPRHAAKKHVAKETGLLRVLHVIPSISSRRGGTTAAVLQMTQALAAAGVACEIATSDDGGPGKPSAPSRADDQVVSRYFHKSLDLYSYTPSFGGWLRAEARTYDLLHIHGAFSHMDAVAARVAHAAGVPYIVTPHGMVGRYGMRRRPLAKRLSFALVEGPMLRRAAAVHLASSVEEEEFQTLGLKKRVAVIPHAVTAMPPGDPEAIGVRHPELRGRTVVAFIGRLHPIKNLEALILAARNLSSLRPDVILAIAGDGEPGYMSHLRDVASANGVGDRIVWTGFLAEGPRSDLLAASKSFVLPSLSESFGVSAVEAASAGLPSALSRTVGAAETLARAGFAVEIDLDAASIAAGIARSLDLPHGSFAREAREFVCRTYSMQQVGAALAALYEDAILARREHAPAATRR